MIGLRHHIGQHVETAPVGHAQNDLFQPHLTAALDDLLKRRNERLAAIEAKPFGALVFHIKELLEALCLDQLLQDCLLAELGEGNALVRSFDAGLNPAFFLRIGNVHELDADGRAVGTLKNRQHFGDRRIFEPQHVIDENLAAVVGFRKSVGRRMQLVVILLQGGQAKRIERCMQVAAHTVGTDHHHRADRILGSLADRSFAQRLTGCLRLACDLCRYRLFDLRPVAIKRGNQFAIGMDGPVVPLPGSAPRILDDVVAGIGKGGKIVLPVLAQ